MALIDFGNPRGESDYFSQPSAPTVSGAPTGTTAGYGGYTAPTGGYRPRQDGPRTSPYSAPPLTPPVAPGGSPAGSSSPYSFNFGTFQNAANQLSQGSSGSLEDFINKIFPALQSQFPDIQRFGSKGDKIRLPGGGVIDAVLSAGTGGRGYQWNMEDGAGSFFDDPIGSWFGGTIDEVMRGLRSPVQLPPEVMEAFGMLRNYASGGARGGPPDMSRLRDATAQRVGELRAEPYSQTEEQGLRVKAFDNLERSRNVARQQTMERLARMGHAPSSGTVEQALRQVDNTFDGLRAQNENQLLTSNIGERQRRRSEAMTLEQQLADAELGSADIGSRGIGQGIGAAQSMAGLAQFIAQQSDPTSRLMMMLQAAGMLGDYSQQQYQNAAGQVG